MNLTPQQKIDRAAHAKRLIEDELVVEVLGKMEADYTTAWKNTGARDTEGRELAWTMVKAVEQFRKEFTALMQDGQIEASRIEQTRRQPVSR